MTTLAKAPTFEEVLVDALTDHNINSNALADLVDETKAAIVTAENDASIAKAVALDPLASPDPVSARATMEDAQFRADRLHSLLPRLQERPTEVGDHEEYSKWRAQFDPLAPKVETAAARLKSMYTRFTAELVPLLAEIEKLDAEVSRVLAAKPYHIRTASNDGCYLRSVELTARGLDNFGIGGHEIMKMEMPDWQHPSKQAWPPERHIDYSHVIPVSAKQYQGADWWRGKRQITSLLPTKQNGSELKNSRPKVLHARRCTKIRSAL